MILIGILLLFTVLVRIFSLNAARAEELYSMGLYPHISTSLRYLLGWLPFSFGDILYGIAFIYLAWKSFKGLRALIKRKVAAHDRRKDLLVPYIV